MKANFILFFLVLSSNLFGQSDLHGVLKDQVESLPFVKISLKERNQYCLSDGNGRFSFPQVPPGNYTLHIFAIGYHPLDTLIRHPFTDTLHLNLISESQEMEEMVVSGSLKEVSKRESISNVEVFTPQFFRKNPSPSLFDALQQVNGVRPQLNCNICNTGDIHINGLEGPYAMILIDGMPIVSNLSTVYGLSGIPNALVERIEIIKGPASALYGSEAIGGVINVITKNPQCAPLISADVHTTSWLETSVDLSARLSVGKKVSVLTGVSYFNYDWIQDQNQDGFTDITVQDRISVFQKWNFQRKDKRVFTLAGRYVYEDRWGGQTQWNSSFRGSDSLYGESIYTSRWEMITSYQLPIREKVFLSLSLNNHSQNSYYGTVPFMADQFIGFGQLYWNKKFKKHDFLLGGAFRYVRYDDNTSATEIDNQGTYNPRSFLPGLFLQNEYRVNAKHKILLGGRLDIHSVHGLIATPRLGYKWDYHTRGIFRLNAGTGYRVVQIFTEDHAALTGARTVVMSEAIRPEKSYNVNVNLNQAFRTAKNKVISFDFNAFYTYFNNRIVADYESDPNYIFYNNLQGHAISQGINLRIDLMLSRNLKIQISGTYADIALIENGERRQQMLTEKFSGNWNASYTFEKLELRLDYTGSTYSPMRLPLLNENDPRPENSPWWSLHNIQLTFTGIKHFEFYGGVKNLFNWTPAKSTPFLIARSNDPFDKQVEFDQNGVAIPSAQNPYGLTFDPSYVYAPNQGIRAYFGIRYTLNK